MNGGEKLFEFDTREVSCPEMRRYAKYSSKSEQISKKQTTSVQCRVYTTK